MAAMERVAGRTPHVWIYGPRSYMPAVLRLCVTFGPEIRRNSRVRSKGNPSNGASSDENQIWAEGAFPQYLQESVEASDFCGIWEDAKARQSQAQNGAATNGTPNKDSTLWRSIRREAEKDAQTEPLLSSFLYASILSHDSFERSLAFVLANRLSDATLLSTELFEVFHSVLRGSRTISEASMADLCAVRERDPACSSYSQALLYFKGYHAIQVQRIAHSLWHAGRRVMAVALQSRASEVFAVDIHPAAKLGKGVLLDHGTGVVIGETAEVGNNVSILQNVTLGGTGKEHGDRHPKVSDNVLIGASATILGNIRIGKGAQVAAGSLVLKAVPPKTMVAGSPAKEVGRVSGNPALNMEQWNERATKDVIQGGYEATHSSAAEPPCEDIFSEGSAPKAGSNGAGEAVLAAAVEQLSVDAKAEPAAESSTSPAVEDSVQDENAPGDEPAAPARVRGGAPPTVAERVEAVTSDKAAKKKWGKAGKDDMEYMI